MAAPTLTGIGYTGQTLTVSSDSDWTLEADGVVVATGTSADTEYVVTYEYDGAIFIAYNSAGDSNSIHHWTPESLVAEPETWIDASYTSSLTLVGDRVQQVDDRTSNGNNAIAPATDRRPQYFASDPVLSLPGIGIVDGTIEGEHGLELPSLSGKELYTVARYKDGLDGTFDHFSTFFSGTGTFGYPRLMGESRFDGNFFISTLTFASGGLFINGAAASSTVVLPMSSSILRVVSTSAQTDVYHILYNSLYTNRGWDGAMGEFIMFSSDQSLEDRQRIEGYLAWKWGQSLEAGHPYQLAPPVKIDAPVLADTLAVSGTVGSPVGGTILIIGGDTPDSFTLSGDDASLYSIDSLGNYSRDSNPTASAVETFTVTATNSAGTSNVMTVTVTISEPSTGTIINTRMSISSLKIGL